MDLLSPGEVRARLRGIAQGHQGPGGLRGGALSPGHGRSRVHANRTGPMAPPGGGEHQQGASGAQSRDHPADETDVRPGPEGPGPAGTGEMKMKTLQATMVFGILGCALMASGGGCGGDSSSQSSGQDNDAYLKVQLVGTWDREFDNA